jgi:hypothetical protein
VVFLIQYLSYYCAGLWWRQQGGQVGDAASDDIWLITVANFVI